jgi:hypothetical protein
VYVLLPRIARGLDAEHHLVANGRFIRIFFIVADVTTVVAQLAGTALTITFGKLIRIGHIVVTIGLWVQLACFLSFVAILVFFGRRMYVSRKASPFGTRALMSRDANQAWSEKLDWRNVSSIRTLTASLGVCCVLMFVRDADPRGKRQSIDGQIRSIYRVAEYTAG